MMDHIQIEELLPVYALGNLGSEDAELITEHLSACESCQSLLGTYEQTVGLLAFGTPRVDPPASLKAELMKRIEIDSSVQFAQKPKQKARSIQSFFQWFSPALAMASLVVIFSLTAFSIVQWNQNRSISYQKSGPLKIIKMKGTQLAPHADGTFVIGQDNLHGVLVASDLPKIPENMQFQLWLIKNDKTTNGGVFSTTPLGYAVMQVSSPEPLPENENFVVTTEPLGGSSSPSGPEMMVGSF
jgi:anti-sigma-K factor RskA